MDCVLEIAYLLPNPVGGCLWLYINPSLRPYLISCVLYLNIRLVNLHSRFYIYTRGEFVLIFQGRGIVSGLLYH